MGAGNFLPRFSNLSHAYQMLYVSYFSWDNNLTDKENIQASSDQWEQLIRDIKEGLPSSFSDEWMTECENEDMTLVSRNDHCDVFIVDWHNYAAVIVHPNCRLGLTSYQKTAAILFDTLDALYECRVRISCWTSAAYLSRAGRVLV